MGKLLTWQDIDGWLSEAEGRILASLATGQHVLEIGTYKGRSTACMAVVAQRVVSVDHHRGDDRTGRGNTVAAFLTNMEAAGVSERVLSIVADAAFVGRYLAHDAFGLVYIDDDHSFDSVLASTKLALMKLESGGTIAWHDWDQADVRRAVTELGLRPDAACETLAWASI